MQVTIFRFHRY